VFGFSPGFAEIGVTARGVFTSGHPFSHQIRYRYVRSGVLAGRHKRIEIVQLIWELRR
jgi:hypothetical protein